MELSLQRWRSDLETIDGVQLVHLMRQTPPIVKPEWSVLFSEVGDVRQAAGLDWERVEHWQS